MRKVTEAAASAAMKAMGASVGAAALSAAKPVVAVGPSILLATRKASASQVAKFVTMVEPVKGGQSKRVRALKINVVREFNRIRRKSDEEELGSGDTSISEPDLDQKYARAQRYFEIYPANVTTNIALFMSAIESLEDSIAKRGSGDIAIIDPEDIAPAMEAVMGDVVKICEESGRYEGPGTVIERYFKYTNSGVFLEDELDQADANTLINEINIALDIDRGEQVKVVKIQPGALRGILRRGAGLDHSHVEAVGASKRELTEAMGNLIAHYNATGSNSWSGPCETESDQRICAGRALQYVGVQGSLGNVSKELQAAADTYRGLLGPEIAR